MEGRQIPGYHYDKEKKKYFQITQQADTPATTRYFAADVRQEKKTENAQRIEVAYRAKVNRQRVKRSTVLHSSTAAGIGITREIAQDVGHSNPTDAAQAYAAGIDKSWQVSVARGHISCFTADPATDSYLIGHGHHNWQEFGATYLATYRNKRRAAYRAISALGQNETTSVSLSPTRVAMTTTMGGQEAPYILISPLADRDFGLPPLCRMQITYRRTEETDVWASAANPFLHDITTFAAALTDRVIIYSDAQGRWTDDTLLRTRTDAVAVEWLGPSVLATGLRTGLVHLSDTRNGDSAMRLQLSSGVTGIRRVSPETLVICGIDDTLAMYDLRMPRVAKIGGPSAYHTAKRRKQVCENITQPCLGYEFESPQTRRGFDVSRESGVVAAVDGGNTVQLYSLRSGRKVKSLRLDGARAREPITQVQFTTTGSEERCAREQLVAACGTDLVGFQWWEDEGE